MPGRSQTGGDYVVFTPKSRETISLLLLVKNFLYYLSVSVSNGALKSRIRRIFLLVLCADRTFNSLQFDFAQILCKLLHSGTEKLFRFTIEREQDNPFKEKVTMSTYG